MKEHRYRFHCVNRADADLGKELGKYGMKMRTRAGLNTTISDTLSPCSSLNVRDQVSYPYKTAGTIIVLYILIFTFPDSRKEGRRFRTEW
jgi:hypothetical protein